MLNSGLNMSRCTIGTLSAKILTARQLIVKAIVRCFQQGEGPSKFREGSYPALAATVAVWSVATVRNIAAFLAVFTGRGRG